MGPRKGEKAWNGLLGVARRRVAWQVDFVNCGDWEVNGRGKGVGTATLASTVRHPVGKSGVPGQGAGRSRGVIPGRTRRKVDPLPRVDSTVRRPSRARALLCRDVESQSHAALAVGVAAGEGVEELIGEFLGDARAFVGDFHGPGVLLAPCRERSSRGRCISRALLTRFWRIIPNRPASVLK